MAKKQTKKSNNSAFKENLALFLSALGCCIMAYQVHLAKKQTKST